MIQVTKDDRKTRDDYASDTPVYKHECNMTQTMVV